MSIDPTRRYEIQGQVCPLMCAELQPVVSNNVVVVPAVAGMITGIMGYVCQANDPSLISQIFFKDGSGGAAILAPNALTFGSDGKLEIKDVVYAKTSVNTALVVDVVGAPAVINLFYIQYAG